MNPWVLRHLVFLLGYNFKALMDQIVGGNGIVRNINTIGGIGDFSLGTTAQGRVSFLNWRNAGTDLNGANFTNSTIVIPGAIQHIAVVWNGVANLLWVNGVSIPFALTGTTADGWGTSGQIGTIFDNNNTIWHFDGNIQDVAIWKNKALTEEQVKSIHNGVRPWQIERSTLHRFFPLTDKAADLSGNADTGTYSGSIVVEGFAPVRELLPVAPDTDDIILTPSNVGATPPANYDVNLKSTMYDIVLKDTNNSVTLI